MRFFLESPLVTVTSLASGRCVLFIRHPLRITPEDTPFNAQAFWDTTGHLWTSGGLYGKFAGVFISTASHGGGQESTAIASMSTLAHHGITYIPLGYAKSFGQLTNLTEVHGGEC